LEATITADPASSDCNGIKIKSEFAKVVIAVPFVLSAIFVCQCSIITPLNVAIKQQVVIMSRCVVTAPIIYRF
jgi:hypothetical protein